MSRIRIIGGEWRSRLIDVRSVKGLRPTPDRVRETLFNWLGQDVDGLRCLDLFAGSGALGFEAASRGAAEVVMVERDSSAQAALEANRRTLGADCVRIVRGDALHFARSTQERFDLIFVDPPYRAGLVEQVGPRLADLLAPDGFAYVEAEYKIENIDRLTRIKHGSAGQVYYHLFAPEN